MHATIKTPFFGHGVMKRQHRMTYKIIGENIRTSMAARAAHRLKLYYLYRGLLVKFGVQNPFAAVLKVTAACNLSCSHCPWALRHKTDMSADRWLHIIDDMHTLGCEVVIFEGGEPTLRADLHELIAHARKKDMLSIVVTNGTNDVSSLHPDSFWFSIDGTRTVHDRIRGDGVFDKAVGNLLQNKAKHRIVATTLSQANAHEPENICATFDDLADGIWFNFLYPYASTCDKPLSRQAAAATASGIVRLKKRYPGIINSDAYLKTVGRRKACYPWWTINVMPDGTVTHGCTVEQMEPCRCEACDLTCYGEPYMALSLRRQAMACLKKASGIRAKHLLLHK